MNMKSSLILWSLTLTIQSVSFGFNGILSSTSKTSSQTKLTNSIVKTQQTNADSPGLPSKVIINNLYDKPGIHLYTYDSKGNIITKIESTTQDEISETTQYNVEGKITSVLISFRSIYSEGMSRRSYTYDSNGNLTLILAETQKDGTWEELNKTIYSFDSNGNLINEKIMSNNEFQEDEQNTYTYDNNNNILSHVKMNYINNSWLNQKKISYTYDGNKNKLSEIEEYWTDNNWVKSNKTNYTYNSNGKVLSKLVEKWSENNWIQEMRDTYTYSSQNQIQTELTETWKLDKWDSNRRVTYTYTNNNLSECLIESSINGSWFNSKKLLYTFHSNGNVNTIENLKWDILTKMWKQDDSQIEYNGKTYSGCKLEFYYD